MMVNLFILNAQQGKNRLSKSVCQNNLVTTAKETQSLGIESLAQSVFPALILKKLLEEADHRSYLLYETESLSWMWWRRKTGASLMKSDRYRFYLDMIAM